MATGIKLSIKMSACIDTKESTEVRNNSIKAAAYTPGGLYSKNYSIPMAGKNSSMQTLQNHIMNV